MAFGIVLFVQEKKNLIILRRITILKSKIIRSIDVILTEVILLPFVVRKKVNADGFEPNRF